MQSYAKMRFLQIEFTVNIPRVTCYSNWVLDKHVCIRYKMIQKFYYLSSTYEHEKKEKHTETALVVRIEILTCASHVERHLRV